MLNASHPILDRLSYRPDSHFALTEGYQSTLHLFLDTIDVKTHYPLTIGNSATLMLRPFAARDLLPMEVERLCIALAIHEVNEWLKVDGKHVTDPHPERYLNQSLRLG